MSRERAAERDERMIGEAVRAGATIVLHFPGGSQWPAFSKACDEAIKRIQSRLAKGKKGKS